MKFGLKLVESTHKWGLSQDFVHMGPWSKVAANAQSANPLMAPKAFSAIQGFDFLGTD